MIVIPMAGHSSRFKAAGYEVPKYMLEARGGFIFDHSLKSFDRYFHSEKFLFICLEAHDSLEFINERCHYLGIKSYEVVSLDNPTLGQAHTVYLGLRNASVRNDENLLIFNIDTIRPGYCFPDCFDIEDVDGYLETFVGAGANWSNVQPLSIHSKKVARTAEKEEISEYCCTGLYYFGSVGVFLDLFDENNSISDENGVGEIYIAPLYNHLIAMGMDIRYTVIPSSSVVFCGVPEEYVDFLEGHD